jgi:hypothetical protein
MSPNKLHSIWIAERSDGKDWSFTTYGKRTEAIELAKRLDLGSFKYSWRAVRFVRATLNGCATGGEK